MATKVDICNLALDMLGAQRITGIDAPGNSREKFFALQYPQQRDGMLRRHRWHFAKVTVRLPRTGDNTIEPKRYSYALPGNCLFVPPHKSGVDWKMRGRSLVSEVDAPIDVLIIQRVAESEFDPLFVDALAARLAFVGCEPLTQSNEKKNFAAEAYKMAMREARQANAFELGTEDIQDDDRAFSWISARMI